MQFFDERQGDTVAPLLYRLLAKPLRLANWGLLACAFLIIATSLYPGRFDGDVSATYARVRPPMVHDWHLPMLKVLLRLLSYVALGPAPMFFVQLGLWFAGLALLTDRVMRQGRPVAALSISALSLFPLTAFQAVEIEKDVMLTALATLLAALGLRSLTNAGAGWTRTKTVSTIRMLTVASLFVFAIDIRKNGFCLLAGLLFLFVPVTRISCRHVLVKSGFVGLLLAGIGISADVMDYSILKAERPHEIYSLAVFDLAGISARTGTDTSLGLLPDFVASAARCYTPAWWDPFLSGGCANVGHVADLLMQEPSSHAALLHAWETAIVLHPVPYVKHRLRYFACFLRISCPTWTTSEVMSGGISWPRAWEPTPYKPTRVGLMFERWSNASARSKLGNGALWMVASIATAAIATRQLWVLGYAPISYFILVVSGSACFYTAMFAVGGVASVLRYLHVTIVFSTIALPLSASVLFRPETRPAGTGEMSAS